MTRKPLYKRLLPTLAVLTLVPASLAAQQANSLYFLENIPNHTQWNPAMAPSRSAIGLGVSGLSVNLRSDLALSDIFQEGPNGPILFLNRNADKASFLSNLEDVTNIGLSTSTNLFHLGLKLGKAYLSLGATEASDMGVGLPKDLFNLVMKGIGTGSDARDLSSLNIGAINYLKAGAGLSIKLTDFLSVGATANYLMGLTDVRLGFDRLTVSGSGTSWNVNSKGNLRITAPDMLRIDYDEDDYFKGISIDDTYSDRLSNDPLGALKPAGKGLSFDVGLTVKPLSFLTLSASVMDLGSISWDKQYIHQCTSEGDFTFEGSDLSNAADNGALNDVGTELQDMMHLKKNTAVDAYSTKLTTKVNVGLEAGLLNNKMSLGVLSQTGISDNGNYQDYMVSANFKPGRMLQTAVTYSLLHGEMSAIGLAANLKILFLDWYVAADYIPLKVTPQYLPVNNSYLNFQTGFNLMF